MTGPEGWDCERCGHTHRPTQGGRPCHGHTGQANARDPGGPCARRASEGQDVCDKHGGAAPQAKAAAVRRKAEARALVELGKLIPDNPEPVRDPIAVLARLGGEADAVRGKIVGYINHLVEADINHDRLEEVAAIVTLYERFLLTTGRFCESLVRSNYLERHAAIEESKIVAVLAVIERGLRMIPDDEMRRGVTVEIANGLKKLPSAS
jgi:hypothetical protein